MDKWICVDTGRERDRISNAVFGVFFTHILCCTVQQNELHDMKNGQEDIRMPQPLSTLKSKSSENKSKILLQSVNRVIHKLEKYVGWSKHLSGQQMCVESIGFSAFCLLFYLLLYSEYRGWGKTNLELVKQNECLNTLH